MIKNNWLKIILILLSVLVIAIVVFKTAHKEPVEIVREIKPVIGNMRTSITSTATVQPQNRLEIKPPINGRIDEILVKEGLERREIPIL